ncbi:unnamed protein product [Symbiodinium sp. CCMP2592]|nr:unnamed protein product [Symbiodinium sp. CCMP2592]
MATYPAQGSEDLTVDAPTAQDAVAAAARFEQLGHSAFLKHPPSLYSGADSVWFSRFSPGAGDAPAMRLPGRVNCLYRARYFVEPRLRLSLLPRMLASSPLFDDALSRLRRQLCEAKAINGNEDPCSESKPRPSTAGHRSLRAISLTLCVANIKHEVLADSRPRLGSEVYSALKTMLARHGGLKEDDVKLRFSPAEWTGLAADSNLQVVATFAPSEEATLEHASGALSYARAQGWLQRSLVEALEAVPGIEDAYANLSGALQLPEQFISLHETAIPVPAADTNASNAMDFSMTSVTTDRRQLTASLDLDLHQGLRNRTAQAVDALFFHFGTHVCPEVVLGGWWKVAASYDASEQESLAVSEALSNAIEEVQKEPRMGARSTLGAAVQISQQRRGGEAYSSTSLQEWRQSLGDAPNVNWRVIDRDLPRCIGIWNWADDDELRSLLCDHWLRIYRGEDAPELANAEQERFCGVEGLWELQRSQEEFSESTATATTTEAASVGTSAAKPATSLAASASTTPKPAVRVVATPCAHRRCMSTAVCPPGYNLHGCDAGGRSSGLSMTNNSCTAFGLFSWRYWTDSIWAVAHCELMPSFVVQDPSPGPTLSPDACEPGGDTLLTASCAGAEVLRCTCDSPAGLCNQLGGLAFEPTGDTCKLQNRCISTRHPRGASRGVRIAALCRE